MPAVIGAVALLAVTRRGAYVSPDSLAYVGTARNLVGGRGYTAPPGSPPLANFPPLYPLALAAVAVFGPDPLTVARFVGPVLFGASVLLVGVLVRRLTGSVRLALAGQLLVVSGVDLLRYHSAALSEPLFLFLALLALAVVAASLRREGAGLVLAAAVLAGMASVTRYVGLAVILAGAAAFAFLAPRRRWKSAVAFTAIALVPLATWLAWVGGATGRASNRAAAVHAPDRDYVVAGLQSASSWFLPHDVWWPLRALVAGSVVAALGVSVRRRRRRAAGSVPPAAALTGPRPSRVLVLFALAYVLALVVDRWLFDVTGRLDERFLLPVHVVAVVLAMWGLAEVDLDRSAIARVALSALVGLQLAAAGLWLYDATTDARIRPGGFSAPAWRHSDVIAQVRRLPPTAAVFTNQVDALYFHTGRVAAALPEKAALLTGRPNPAYHRQLRDMLDALDRDGVVVYFTAAPARRVFLPSAQELAARLNLEPVARDEVGVLYRPGAAPSGAP